MNSDLEMKKVHCYNMDFRVFMAHFKMVHILKKSRPGISLIGLLADIGDRARNGQIHIKYRHKLLVF